MKIYKMQIHSELCLFKILEHIAQKSLRDSHKYYIKLLI